MARKLEIKEVREITVCQLLTLRPVSTSKAVVPCVVYEPANENWKWEQTAKGTAGKTPYRVTARAKASQEKALVVVEGRERGRNG